MISKKNTLVQLRVVVSTGEPWAAAPFRDFPNWVPANMASSSTPSLWPLAYNSGLEEMNMEPTNSPGNYTQSKTLARLTFPITVVISLFGLFWNGTVLWLLGFRIKRNAFSVYVLNLAGADFTFLCCQLFFVLTDILTGSYDISLTILHFKVKWHFYSTFPMAKLVAPIAFSSYTMDMSLLAAISTERCLSVLCPVWYRFHRPKHLSTIVCVLLWTKSLLVCTLTGDSCGFLSRGYSRQACYHLTVVSAVLILLLVSVMCVSSLTLLLRVQCSSQRHHPTKIYVIILLTVLGFLLCGLPFGMYWLLLDWYQTLLQPMNLPYYLIDILSCMNSSVNPIIYFFVGSFRRWRKWESLRVVLQRALRDEVGVEKESSHTGTMELSV
ncbi:PREDICTED: mas-related G-protein coupled receptor member X1-like [Chrysochloris asiatica]|uniref:Mas-related G-protein coupled receptor member X1-like n=1 Tax=Chrysochloris asiatica TaxID=185453 RepID=A0A9B0TI20_CHRAS|nr:PREDICTED: mas-related G-protein coupled receptor member X1-like [Chrysochloris asiatica]